jgi:hypothetical protein
LNEGWFDDQYIVLFSVGEASSATARYRLAEALPGYSVVGLLGWDDFLLRAPSGDTWSSPTVPLIAQHLAPCPVPSAESLQPDSRYVERVKWYITPVAFGGDPGAQDNQVWVTHQQHAELVVWWNAKYRELKAQAAGVA